MIVYRAFFEPGVFGFVRTQLPRLLPRRRSGHPPCPPNACDTTLAYASRALQARMGWEMPWYTITDSFDKDFGVDEWHGHNVFFRNGERGFPHILRQQPGRRSAASYANPIELSSLGGAKIARAIVNLVLNVSAKGSAARVVVT